MEHTPLIPQEKKHKTERKTKKSQKEKHENKKTYIKKSNKKMQNRKNFPQQFQYDHTIGCGIAFSRTVAGWAVACGCAAAARFLRYPFFY